MGRKHEIAPQASKTEHSRRQFLQKLGILGAGLLGIAAGSGAWRILQNEGAEQYVIDEQVLLALAKKNAGPKIFGLYPDFEHPTGTPWEDLDFINKEVVPTRYVGTFALLRTFESAQETQILLEQLWSIKDRGSTPVISLGANLPSEYQGHHPFHTQNLPVIEKLSVKAAQTLNQFDGELINRLFYEPQVPTFLYGPREDFVGAEHVHGYQKAFGLAAQAFAKHRHDPTPIAFAPWVEKPIRPYFPRRGKKILADMVGFDAYDLFPGKGQLKHPNYWAYGDRTPEELLLPVMADLHAETKGKLPVVGWELGSYTRDPSWLRHATLLLFALGGSGMMYFNYDKRSHQLPWETDWRMNLPLQEMYRRTWQEMR